MEGCRGPSKKFARAGDVASHRHALAWILSADFRPHRFAGVPQLFYDERLSMMAAIQTPSLEIAVLVLGMLLLMVEAFGRHIEKPTLGLSAIAALTTVLVASFFVRPNPAIDQTTGFWSFYAADALAIF